MILMADKALRVVARDLRDCVAKLVYTVRQVGGERPGRHDVDVELSIDLCRLDLAGHGSPWDLNGFNILAHDVNREYWCRGDDYGVIEVDACPFLTCRCMT